MASYIRNSAVTGGAVSTDGILLKSILVTPTSAGTQDIVTVYSAGVAALIITVKDTSFEYSSVSGGNQFSLTSIPGPVTIDVPANTFVRIEY
jgi:hypothetical protein